MAEIEDQIVTYTVKELLAQINHAVTVIDTKLDTKAEKSDVHALSQRVSLLERFKERAVGAAILIAASGSAAGFALKELLG